MNKKFEKKHYAGQKKHKNVYPESSEMKSLSERPKVIGFFFTEKEAFDLALLVKNVLGENHPTVQYMEAKINFKNKK